MGGDDGQDWAELIAREAAKAAAKRGWAWAAGGGFAFVAPALPVIIAAVAGLALLAGIGAWVTHLLGPKPPAIATRMSRPAEWLASVTALTDKYHIPNVVGLAVIEQASDGQVYGDRYYCSNQQSTGAPCSTIFHPGAFGLGSHGVHTLGIGVGLMGLDTKRVPGLSATNPGVHAVSGNLTTGLKRLAAALHTTPDAPAGLAAFHAGTQTPPGWVGSGQYTLAILSLIQSYQAGPTLGAWALAPWSSKTGLFEDPGHVPMWVFAVGTDPAGSVSTLTLKPPSPGHTVTTTRQVCRMVTHTVTTTTPGPPITHTVTVVLRGPHGQRITHTVTRTTKGPPIITIRHTRSQVCRTVTVRKKPGQTHIWKVRGLAEPIQVWGTTAKGHRVAFTLSVYNPKVPVWSGGSVWGAEVPLTGPNRLTRVTAAWSNGVQDSIPWPEQHSGVVGTVHIVTDQQAITAWWPDILTASRRTGTPAAFIAAEMLVESHGDPTAEANGLAGAYGLMQLEPGTDGATNADRQNPLQNLIFGARYLAGLHQDTGSWRLASASYYGGLGSVEQAGWHAGMTYSQAEADLSRFIPFPSAGNSLSLAQYANDVEATSGWVRQHHPKG